MSYKLSIIIPCYNCASTLKEAVDSCYLQDLTEDEFEIIMVDDGSHDETAAVMTTLSREHKNIRLITHPENRGGGAARNTGIRAALGEVIYCLDSDNFFAPRSVKPMLFYLAATKADGVAFYERRFFIGSNTAKYTAHYNHITDRPIELIDLFNDSGTLLDNFFYTKLAYEKTTGYPEHHGFDTQSFEMRFLSAGNQVYVTKDSFFWHRQAGGQKSYFERVYESGEFSLNRYYIFEDIMHLFSKEAREFIFAFDIFGRSKLGTENLMGALVNQFTDVPEAVFIPNYRRYLNPQGRHEYQADFPNDLIINAILVYRAHNYLEATKIYQQYLTESGPNAIIYYNILRCTIGVSGVAAPSIEKQTKEAALHFILKQQRIDLNPNWLKRLIYKIVTFVR